MGATGHSLFRKRSESASGTFGIGKAVVYKGAVPPDSNLDTPSRNKLTLKVPTNDGNVLYQFKLSKDKQTMTVIGYLDGPKEVKAKVTVDAKRPSLDHTGDSRQETANVRKLRDLMSRSSVISDEQLGQIARSLANTKGRMM